MARTVLDLAQRWPIFDKFLLSSQIVNSGSGYDPEDPPRPQLLDVVFQKQRHCISVIDEDSGKIIHVRVLERGRGYDPLRLQILPSESLGVIDSFDINRIWQSHLILQLLARLPI